MTWEADQLGHINEAGWLPPRSRLLVAVSGGCDSMALLHLLCAGAAEREWDIGVAHLDHGLRTPESQEDAEFVQQRAAAYGVRIHIRRQDIAALAAAQGQSIEMVARSCRHDWFETLHREHGYTHSVLAHTLDDQAETVLMRLLRGCGSEGLQAMSPVSQLRDRIVVRPLLTCSKDELKDYLRQKEIPWREDASNQDPAYLRNRVRHQLVPLLQSYNPRITATLARTAELLRQDYSILAETVAADYRACVQGGAESAPQCALDLRPWRTLSEGRQRHVLHRWLVTGIQPETITCEIVHRLHCICLSNQGSQRISLPGNLTAIRQYDALFLEPKNRDCSGFLEPIVLCEGETQAADFGVQITMSHSQGFRPIREEGVGTYPAAAYLSAAVIAPGELSVRSWQSGDRMIPFGMSGSRKIQDIFTDAKIPEAQRHTIPLFISQGQIVWIPGYRIAAHAAVESATAPSLHIRITRMSP